ncbi:MAG: nucleoside-diphosphate sugar epimerase/dehydratase [Oscillospiraceae bacterium]|nr:nucleoside-diphosphate sugar epimerase/dehydratase [Oscillospiraceae bacterium]
MKTAKTGRALAAADMAAVWVAAAVSFRLRFGFIRPLPEAYRQNQWIYMACMGMIFLGVAMLCGLYREKEREPLARCAGACGATAFCALALDRLLGLGIPVEIILIFALALLTLLLALRKALDGTMRRRHRQDGSRTRAVIYGAGEAGCYLAGRLLEDPGEGLIPVGFVDDRRELIGKKRAGLRVLGGLDRLEKILLRCGAQELIIAIERLSPEKAGEALAVCRRMGCRARRFGTLEDLSDHRLAEARIQDIRLEDLLRREPVRLDMERVKSMTAGRCVLVTGGAGSIGSELCRQALRYGARRVVVFDICENGLFHLGEELEAAGLLERCRLKVGSVRDAACLEQVMRQENPEVVFHAAAHKHVPLMEQNPLEAVKNNVFGTINCAEAALRCDVKRFVLISTDKAMNPVNIMGAAKRTAELWVQMMARERGCVFSAVRFGNVLGSEGSVVQSFARQIEEGGPVTVTHPEMRRYFMTIPEAVQLVMEAGAMAAGGEIFVLDMGEPVKICDLARDMIRLAGLRPDEDIALVFTGPRPGEKLFEEICLREESVRKTENQKIFVNRAAAPDPDWLRRETEVLRQAVQAGDLLGTAKAMERLVPSFAQRGNIPGSGA